MSVTEFEKTNRGFNIYDKFTDTYNTEIQVQESSCADAPRCWIFTENDLDGDASFMSPHLSVEQAKRVIKALQAFIDDAAKWVV